jgi:hypothetical protein
LGDNLFLRFRSSGFGGFHLDLVFAGHSRQAHRYSRRFDARQRSKPFQNSVGALLGGLPACLGPTRADMKRQHIVSIETRVNLPKFLETAQQESR